MSNICVAGLQWGDEGKGKVVDQLTSRFDIVARYQGGSNAGHTVITDRRYVLHLIPSGILHKDCVCVIGNGVVLDPGPFLEEIQGLTDQDIQTDGRLWLSDRAHLVMPYHKILDRTQEASKGKDAIGTTGRGIGPCYADKISRTGLRVGELFHKDNFVKRARQIMEFKNKLLTRIFDEDPLDIESIIEQYLSYGECLKPYTIDTISYLNQAVNDKKSILFEGAQGALLDVDFGTYPFVTSSNSTVPGLATGIGVSTRSLDNVFGVLKAYTTRVGAGPFPTELFDADGENLAKQGNEFGATTGRPRRCGWLDLVALRYALSINDIDQLILTKLDVLDSFKKIRVCVAYRLYGETVKEFPSNPYELEQCEPVYEDYEGWEQPTGGITQWPNLPRQAQEYIQAIENHLKTSIKMISVGAGRGAIIER